jgi:ankyrin repeat protein
LLLESGADKGVHDHRGLTAFDHATQQNNSEALTLLGQAA